MFDHIKAFSELLAQKGYDGNFHSPYGFYDKLRDNLTRHVFQCFEEQKKLEKINLATYTHWKDNDSPYIRCSFETNYTPVQGFQVEKVNIEYGNRYGALRQKGVIVTNNDQIPARLDANKIVAERRTTKHI